MPDRAFYRLTRTVWEGLTEPVPDVVVVHVGSRAVYLYSARDPNPALEELGAKRVAGSWAEMRSRYRAAADRIFRAEVDRELPGPDGKPRKFRVRARRADLRAGERVVRDWIPPVVWAGDDASRLE